MWNEIGAGMATVGCLVLTVVILTDHCGWRWPGRRRYYTYDRYKNKWLRESWSAWYDRGWKHEED